MATTRSSFIKAMVKDKFPYAIESYDKVVKVSDQVFDVDPSDSAYEQYTSAIGPGAITEVTEGTSIPAQSAQEGYTVICANKKRATRLTLTNEAIDDNQKISNMLEAWAKGCGESFANSRESDHMAVFNYGGYTSGNSTFDNSIPGVITPSYGNFMYDGKPVFALSGNNHIAKNGATYYNSKASLTLSGQNLETMLNLIAVTNAFNEAGLEIQIMPDTLLVQYGSSNYYKAKRLLESMADLDAVQSGVTNVWKGSLNLIGSRFLTNSDAYFIGKAKMGLKSLNRMPLKVDYYESHENDSQKVKCIARWGKCVTNFRGWVGANLSTS